jgi:phosphoribosyl 1,2-cyclic phosphodiesterase
VINMGNDSMVIKYWGMRGSIPAPLTNGQEKEKQCANFMDVIKRGGTSELFGNDADAPGLAEKIMQFLNNQPKSLAGTYGGDTTCLEIQARDSPLIILDAGSGIRALGNVLLGRLFSENNLNPLDSDQERKHDLHLFFSHYHWDHIQGFPFFGPAFIPGDKKVNIHFYGKKNAKTRLSDALKGQQEYPLFPVGWKAMPCKKTYKELGRIASTEIPVGKVVVKYAELDHPDRVLGYSMGIGGKKFVCATDTEHRAIEDPFLIELAKDADILYYDAQYTPEEYSGKEGPSKVRWGHSTFELAVKTALAANVDTVVLGHHEPTRSDFKVEELMENALEFRNECLRLPGNEGKALNVVMAYQGLEQRL